nr:uncharacterized protein LOC109164549 isoform X1 [Ipomoea batatas]
MRRDGAGSAKDRGEIAAGRKIDILPEVSTRNMSAQSSMYFRTPMAYRGGFAAFARGQQFSSGQVMHLPPGSNYFSQGLGIQAAESSNIQPVMRNQFPTRFGISQADLLGTQQSARDIWFIFRADLKAFTATLNRDIGSPSSMPSASDAGNIAPHLSLFPIQFKSGILVDSCCLENLNECLLS